MANVGRFRNGISDEERINRIFIALADEQRRQILNLLRDEELQPAEILDRLGEECRSLSYHLRILRDSQLVLVREDGRAHHYRLNKTEYVKLIRRIEGAGGLHSAH